MIIARKVEDGAQSVTAVAGYGVDADTVLRPVVEAGKSYHFRLLLKLETAHPEDGIAVDFSASTCSIDGSFAGSSGEFWMQMWGPAGESAPYNVVAADPLSGSNALNGGSPIEFVDDVPQYLVIEGFIRPTVGGELRPAYARAAGDTPGEPVSVGAGSMLMVEECS